MFEAGSFCFLGFYLLHDPIRSSWRSLLFWTPEYVIIMFPSEHSIYETSFLCLGFYVTTECSLWNFLWHVEVKAIKELGPELANKDTNSCLVEYEFQINNELISLHPMQHLGYKLYKKNYLFIWNSNLTRCPVFYLATLNFSRDKTDIYVCFLWVTFY